MYQGDFTTANTIYVFFNTFDSNDPSASVTLTGLAVTDIEIYKDGSATQRSSDSGYTLLDTDGIDFDTTTGIHGFSIDLSDNTDAGFFAAGSEYAVIVASVTVDAATVNFVAATFSIERTGGALALLKGTNSLANIEDKIDIIDTVVDGIQTDLDNGTDGLGAIKTDTAAILVDTAEIGTAGAGLTDLGGMSTGMKAEVEAEVDDGLIAKGLDHLVFASVTGTDIADDSIIAQMTSKSATADWDSFDNTTDALEAVSDLVTTVDTVVDSIATDTAAILVDTADMQPKLGSPAADISADIAAVKVDTAAILVDTADMQPKLGSPAADISADIAAVKVDTAAILVDTADMQPKIGSPAADVSADIAAVKVDTAAILVDTGTTLPALIDDLAVKKNATFSNFEFLMVLTSDHVTPATGLTVTGQRSIDGGAFAGVSGTIAEVSNGIYQFDAVAADTNGDVITWRFSSGTADDTFVTFKTVA